jgi:hypothetical protein
MKRRCCSSEDHENLHPRLRDLEVYKLLRCKHVREPNRTSIHHDEPPHHMQSKDSNTTVVAAFFIYQPFLTNHIPALVHGLYSICIQALQFPRLRFSNFPLTPEALTLAVQPTDHTTTHASSSIQSQCTRSFSQNLLRNRTNPQVPQRHKLSSVHP